MLAGVMAARRACVAAAAGWPAARHWTSTVGPPVLDPLPPHFLLRLPLLSPTVTRGRLTAWRCAVGQQLRAGDALLDVHVDRLVEDRDSGPHELTVECHEDDVFFARHLVPAGQWVDVGTPIALLCESRDDIAALQAVHPYVPSASAAEPLWQAHLAGAAPSRSGCG